MKTRLFILFFLFASILAAADDPYVVEPPYILIKLPVHYSDSDAEWSKALAKHYEDHEGEYDVLLSSARKADVRTKSLIIDVNRYPNLAEAIGQTWINVIDSGKKGTVALIVSPDQFNDSVLTYTARRYIQPLGFYTIVLVSSLDDEMPDSNE